MAKRNLLLEYSEELAVKIAKLCNEYKIDSNTVFQITSQSMRKNNKNAYRLVHSTNIFLLLTYRHYRTVLRRYIL